jgi:hypothetical protein
MQKNPRYVSHLNPYAFRDEKKNICYTHYSNTAVMMHKVPQIGMASLPGDEFSCGVLDVVDAAIAPATSEGCLSTAAAVVVTIVAGAVVTPQAI